MCLGDKAVIVVSKSSFEKMGHKPPHLLRVSLLLGSFVLSSLQLDAAYAVPGRSTFQMRGATPETAPSRVDSASSRNSSADPLAFLEGSPSCDEVVSGVERRYKKDGTGVRALPANLLLEEFRHVALETCSSDKFSECDFHWCRSKKTTQVVKEMTPPPSAVAKRIEVATEKADSFKPSISDEELKALENSRARLANPAKTENEKVTAEKAIASTKRDAKEDFSEEPFEKSAVVEAVAKEEDVFPTEVAVKSAPASDLAVEKEAPIAAKKLDIAPLKPAELTSPQVQAKFAELLREKNQRQLAMIEAKRTEENKYNLVWRAVTVPGSKPPPRVSKGDEPSESEKGGQFMRTKTSQTSTSLEDHVATDNAETELSMQDQAKARVNNQSLSNGQDAYFRMLRSRSPQARGGARARGGFPQLNMGDSDS